MHDSRPVGSRSLGDPFLRALPQDAKLPTAVLDLHTQPGRFKGRCQVTRGRGMLIALALRIGRFPPTGEDLPVSLTTQKVGEDWLWRRNFAGHLTQSRLSFDAGWNCVREQIGGLTIWIRPVWRQDRLGIEVVRMKICGLPCPKALLPQSFSFEWQDAQGRFCFDISARLPWFGSLIRYHGWLTRDHEGSAQP